MAFASIMELAKDLQKSSKSHSVRFMSIADTKSKSKEPHQEHAADDQSVVRKSQSGWVANNKEKFTQPWRSPPQNHRSQSIDKQLTIFVEIAGEPLNHALFVVEAIK